MTSLDSKVISLLRFPLILGVVCIHARYGGAILQTLFGGLIGRLSVPMFLIISGYLFFSEGGKGFSKEFYLKKIKSRFRSLFIPYLLWNCIAYLLYVCSHEFVMKDFIHAFWVIDIPNRTGSSPMDAPLWYVRNLIMMVSISPAISLMFKYTKGYLLCIIGLCWLFQFSFFSKGIGISFFFFSLGGYLRVSRVGIEKIKYGYSLIALYILYLLESLGCYSEEKGIVDQVGIVVGMLALLALMKGVASKVKQSNHIWILLAESSFFIYCCHDLLFWYLKDIWQSTFGYGSCSYIILVFLNVALCVLIYSVFKRYIPRLCSILVGGR